MPATELTPHPQPDRKPSRYNGVQIRQDGSRFGTTHVTGESLLQGNFVGVTINSTAAAQADYSGQFTHSSLVPVKAFVARDTLHSQIYTQLGAHATYASTRMLAVWGLGGVGKTQLVLDYVRQHRTEYKATFWIEAGRKESLERDIVRLYETLFGLVAAADAETVSVEEALTRVKSWFSGRQGPWLMVFDGADAIEDSITSGYVDIQHFIPDVASLHVIVTSRSSAAGDMMQQEGVRVGEMEEVQAVELFYCYSRLPREDAEIRDQVTIIVRELGCLALAVTLAAAHVGRTPRLQSDIKGYLSEYRQWRRELLERKPEKLVHQYSESVLTTWETSYRAVAEQCPEGSVLMTMLSCLSFDDIFLGLFSIDEQVKDTGRTEDEVDSDSASWRNLLSPGQRLDRYMIEECFRVLQKYSLVQWKADQQSYTMHKLVHAWSFDRLTGDEQRKISQVAFKLILEVVRAVKDSKGAKDKLRVVPHVMASFAALGGESGGWEEVTEGLLDNLEEVGLFLQEVGKSSDQRAVQEVVLEKRRQILGGEHPDTITAMANLANTLEGQGYLTKAAIMKKEVLEKRRRILGEEHPFTISATNELAVTLRGQGQLNKPIEMFEEVLRKRRRILGEEHPLTISAMNELTVTARDKFRLDELFREERRERRQLYGYDHPNSYVASTYGDQVRWDAAEELQMQVMMERKRVLGEEHLDTLTSMSDEQDDQTSTTETFSTPWSDQERSTNPTSLSYEAAADTEQIAESRSSMTFFNYQKPAVGPDDRHDDIQTVKSVPDDIQSLVESTSGAGNYRQAAVNYIVKMFTSDVELLALYQEATERISGVKFVKSHERLLKKFFLDLGSERHSPSQALAVGFLRARSKRTQISSGIRNLVMPSDNTIREKISVLLKQDKDHLFLVNRFLDESDFRAQPTPTNTAAEVSDGNLGIELPVSSHADTTSKESDDSDEDEEDDDRSDDGPEAEIGGDNALSKLEATGEFLTSGRPFSLYKENLRRFLHPAPTSPEQPFSNHSEGDSRDVTDSSSLEVQASDTTQLMHNEESPKEELPTSEKPEQVSDSIYLSNPARRYQPKSVTVTWKCRCGVVITDQFTEFVEGAVQTHLEERTLRYKDRANVQNTSPGTRGWFSSIQGTLHDISNLLNKSFVRRQTQSQEATNSRVADDGSAESPPPANLTGCPKHLQLCISRHHLYTKTSYTSHDLRIESDKRLYDLLRAQYAKLTGRWKRLLSLRQIRQIRFVKFRLRKNKLVTIEAHSEMEARIRQSLPRENDDDYDFAPPEPDFLPPIGHNEMMHYFNTPCEGQDEDYHMRRFPGHKRNPVPFQPTEEEKHVWGIELVESESRQWLYLSLPIFIVVFSSMAFGITWTAVMHDIQGGFTVAGYIVTSGLALLGSIQVLLETV